MSGPDTSATRSRFPDHPETVKVPVVHPIEMTMLRKLITTGETWCTTCSSNGRNKVTEVCVIPYNARIHNASPIGALTDSAPRGKRLSAARRSSRKVRPTSATAAAIKRIRDAVPGTDPLAATQITPPAKVPNRKNGAPAERVRLGSRLSRSGILQ